MRTRIASRSCCRRLNTGWSEWVSALRFHLAVFRRYSFSPMANSLKTKIRLISRQVFLDKENRFIKTSLRIKPCGLWKCLNRQSLVSYIGKAAFGISSESTGAWRVQLRALPALMGAFAYRRPSPERAVQGSFCRSHLHAPGGDVADWCRLRVERLFELLHHSLRTVACSPSPSPTPSRSHSDELNVYLVESPG